MSDIGISYDGSIQPPVIGASLNLSFSDTTLKATIRDVSDFVIVLKPSGNISEQILSGVAYPLAQTIGLVLPPLGKDLIRGYSFDVVTISPITQNVGGETLTIKPSNLNISNFNGMLMVQGTVDIS